MQKIVNIVRLISVTSLILLVNACSTGIKKDGPPRFDVDVSHIPDAVPKKETLSKYGNMSVYHVFGKPYYVMKSSKNYHARGIASWYGTKFHAQRTSSGEPYNMLSMTAAHKTLPLPTYVQVTNLANGKKVIVKVNDRGPFEGSRLIDLSYVAAKKLGMLGHGTAHVDVKAIEPGDYNREKFFTPISHHATYLAKNKPQHKGNPVYIQVGAFKNKTNAENLKKRLVALVDSPVRVANSKELYRVQIGPIEDHGNAAHISKRLKTLGLAYHQSHRDITEV